MRRAYLHLAVPGRPAQCPYLNAGSLEAGMGTSELGRGDVVEAGRPTGCGHGLLGCGDLPQVEVVAEPADADPLVGRGDQELAGAFVEVVVRPVGNGGEAHFAAPVGTGQIPGTDQYFLVEIVLVVGLRAHSQNSGAQEGDAPACAAQGAAWPHAGAGARQGRSGFSVTGSGRAPTAR